MELVTLPSLFCFRESNIGLVVVLTLKKGNPGFRGGVTTTFPLFLDGKNNLSKPSMNMNNRTACITDQIEINVTGPSFTATTGAGGGAVAAGTRFVDLKKPSVV